MIKNLFAILLISSFSLGALAQGQPQGNKGGNKQANKVAIITSKLNLTSEEAEKFWPIYNERTAKFKELKKELKSSKGDKKISEMNDQEVESVVQKGFEIQEKELAIKKEYHEKFKAVLPVKKVAKLYHVEHSMKKQKAPQKSGGNGQHPKQRR